MRILSLTRICWTGVFALAAVGTAFAAPQTVEPTQDIQGVSTSTTFAVIELADTIATSCNDEGTTNHIVIEWKLAPDRKVLYGTAMAAYSLGKKVGFVLNGCHRFDGGTPMAIRVDIANDSI